MPDFWFELHKFLKIFQILEPPGHEKSIIKYVARIKLTQLIDSLQFQGGTLIANAQGIDGSGGTEICIGVVRPSCCHFHQPKWREENE
jgi:hypothetical protein